LVEENYSVLDIADILKTITPDLEMLFVNQHLQLRNLEVEADPRINALIQNDRSQMETNLKAFLNHMFLSK
jgi:hypothetical protein